MGYRGGLDTAITLLIFFTVGSESGLGNYSAVFALLGLITAFLVKRYLNKENNKKVFIISSILIMITTFPIIIFNSFILFVVYNIVFNIAYKITQIIVDSEVFFISGNKMIGKYKIKYTYLTEAGHALGKVLSELLLLIVTICYFSYHNYQIVVAILSLSIILQALVYKRE